jgi:AcrR family transcriptional regulator
MGKPNMKKDLNTEEKILQAAREVFQQKGYDGARMRDIADMANINKGLLHYYFRTKDALFEKIFGIAFQTMAAQANEIFSSDASLFDKIRTFTEKYIDLISRNEYLPRFVINEINRNPDQFIEHMQIRKKKPVIHVFIAQFEEEIAKGTIKAMDARQFCINMIALCIFPFVGRPMMQTILDIDHATYKQMMQKRKKEVAEFLIAAIKK